MNNLHDVFSCFDWDKALNRMMEQRKRMKLYMYQERAIIGACNRMKNQCRYPVLCGNAIYGVDIDKMVHTAIYLTRGFKPYISKRYVFICAMRLLLKSHIPWAEKGKPIKYKHYPYSRYVPTLESYNGPVGVNCRPLLVTFEHINTNEYITINKKEEE